MRPFDVGDLVVLDDGLTGTVINRNPVSQVAVKITGSLFERHSVYFIDSVKTIRHPRKGSKEARDIVAMLARNYKRERRFEWNIDKRLRHWSDTVILLKDLYFEAKEMLK